MSTTGDIRKDEVKNVLEKCVPGVKKCWNEECKQGLCGKEDLVVKLIIDSSGNVEEVILGKGVNIGKKLRECIVQELGRIKFSQSTDDVKRIVTLELLFE